jgi:hypothetical protein
MRLGTGRTGTMLELPDGRIVLDTGLTGTTPAPPEGTIRVGAGLIGTTLAVPGAVAVGVLMTGMTPWVDELVPMAEKVDAVVGIIAWPAASPGTGFPNARSR